ncbi:MULTISPECIES: SIP domain-containing protein [unclassified Microbacterium]|uniref:SIP domain-containing protein n=1 Tax=unclassified Microbacterium TaxID=2609290 RepID=UPI0012FAA35F|nr:SIP domain-containing protein [Microbacterium sp. MAH-37]MVQ41739.1 phage tail protein [Microbacterium sp. MAH-37]
MRTSLDTATSRSQRREARRRSHHLVTADENSLADLELFIATLPLCASGRIFIEVPDASDIGVIEAPGRMTVTWLARSSRTGATGTGRLCAPGEALARATCAWADEMLCDDQIETRVTLLGGFLGTADIVDHLTESLGMDAAAISVPESYGLLTR